MSRYSNETFTLLIGLLFAAATAGVGCGDMEAFFGDDPEASPAQNDAGDSNDDDPEANGDNDAGDDNDPDGGGGNGGENNGGEVTTGQWEWVDSPAQQAHINAIHFHDDQRGWMATDGDPLVADRGAWYTDDGGGSWEFRRQDFDAYVVRYDAQGDRVWMGGSDSRELWVADDGEDFRPIDEGLEQQDWIGSLYFWDADTGILGSQTGERIHRTTDGGEAFEQFQFEDDYVNGINNIEVHGDEVWATSGADFTQDNTGGVVLYSEDRAASWELIEFEDNAHHYEGGSIQDVHVVDENEIWAAGVNRQLYYTDDGMDSWDQIDGIPNEINSFRGIDGHGDHIVAGGNHDEGIFIWESTDGGQSWEMTFEDTSCGSGCEINGIEYVHSGLAFGYGYGNTLIAMR